MNLKTKLLDLLFPPKCPFCRRLLEDGDGLLCPRCQMTLPWLVGPGAKRRVEHTDGCFSPLAYRGLVVEAVHRYKFKDLRHYEKAFGLLMAQCAQDGRLTQAQGVTWAPLSRGRLRQRGYDQAKLLALRVGRALDLPVVPALAKVRETPPQSLLTKASERRANAAGAYAIAPGFDGLPKRLILVDDVVTSGATLAECARLLRLAGAEQVWGLTLAQAGAGGKFKEKTVENHYGSVYNEK